MKQRLQKLQLIGPCHAAAFPVVFSSACLSWPVARPRRRRPGVPAIPRPRASRSLAGARAARRFGPGERRLGSVSTGSSAAIVSNVRDSRPGRHRQRATGNARRSRAIPISRCETSDGRKLESDAAWNELEARLGAPVPAGNLRFWMLGLAAPGEHQWHEANADGVVDAGAGRLAHRLSTLFDRAGRARAREMTATTAMRACASSSIAGSSGQ